MLKVAEREQVKLEAIMVEKKMFDQRCEMREVKRKLGEAEGDEDLLISRREKRRKREDGSIGLVLHSSLFILLSRAELFLASSAPFDYHYENPIRTTSLPLPSSHLPKNSKLANLATKTSSNRSSENCNGNGKPTLTGTIGPILPTSLDHRLLLLDSGDQSNRLRIRFRSVRASGRHSVSLLLGKHR